MAIPYERYEDTIEVDPENISIDSGDIDEEDEGHSDMLAGTTHLEMEDDGEVEEGSGGHRANRMSTEAVLDIKWPYGTGVMLMVWGFIVLAMGAAETSLMPVLSNSTMASFPIVLKQENCYGLGLWAGLMLIFTGCIGLRAAIYHTVSLVYMFFLFILLDIVIFITFILIILISYGKHQTTKEAFSTAELPAFYLHVCVSMAVVVGFVFIVLAYTQYYEDVFCGDLQCCKRTVHCICPCFCPRAIHQEELLYDNSDRPPSLPI